MSSRIHLYFFRHGETDWNLENRFQGHTDIPLNETGRFQARELRKKILPLKPTEVISSDLSRARETAELALEGLNLKMHIYPELRECRLGKPEGMIREDVMELFGMNSWDRWFSIDPSDFDFSFPGGETKREHVERVTAKLRSHLLKSIHTRVAVSTHGGTLRRMIHAS